MGAARIAVLPIAAIGHVTPMLAIVAALTACAERPCVRVYGHEPHAAAFRSIHAEFEAVTGSPGPGAPPHSAEATSSISDLAVKSFLAPQASLQEVIHAVRAFGPDVVLYDVFSLAGAVASRTLGVPGVSLFTSAGLGAFGNNFEQDHGPPSSALTAANDRLVKDFGVDVLGDAACLPVLFPSRQLSIVTATSAQCPAVNIESPKLRDIGSLLDGTMRYVGPCVSDVPLRSDADDDVLIASLDRGRARGATIVLFSLGTNIATFRGHTDVGSGRNGREFARSLLALTALALGDDPAYQVVVAAGGLAPDGLYSWPQNFLLRQFVPQRRLLASHTDVFLTHHGTSSTAEAVVSAVPMVALPAYGDQIVNAEYCMRRGISTAYWDIRDVVATCTMADLRNAVAEAGADGLISAACFASVQREFASAGGSAAAARHVLSVT
jgi:MGT family glycosyltransferase